MMRPLALHPQGAQAEPVAALADILYWGGVAITAMVVALIALALVGPGRWRRALGRERTVIIGGLVFPIVILTALLVVGLGMTASLGRAEANELQVRITGYRWWWSVNYPGFASANELVVPVGRPVRIELASGDVLHNFWVPELAGKRYMIPGKTNSLLIKAGRPGEFYAICAEYCGGPHALMQFRVRALPPAEWTRWAAAQRLPATAPAEAAAERGAVLFGQLGCGGCHRVAGTRAAGGRGPDLTHVAARTRIGAGILDNTRANLRRFTANPHESKPGVNMPAFTYLPAAELDALAAYMDGLA